MVAVGPSGVRSEIAKNFRATPLDASPQFFLWLILGAPGRRIEQSLNAPSAKGSRVTTVSPLHTTRQARPTSGSICRFSGSPLSGYEITSSDSGNCDRKPSTPGAYQGNRPLGAYPSVTTVTKSPASPACSRCPAKFPATPNPNQD